MESFLEKLDREAGRWLGEWDKQLQKPIIQVMTGKVFTHGTTSNNHNSSDHLEQPAAQPQAAPNTYTTRELNKKDGNVVLPVWSKNLG